MDLTLNLVDVKVDEFMKKEYVDAGILKDILAGLERKREGFPLYKQLLMVHTTNWKDIPHNVQIILKDKFTETVHKAIEGYLKFYKL